MKSRSRRQFLQTATLLPSLAVATRAAFEPQDVTPTAAEETVLDAIAVLVLPVETLGTEGLESAIARFRRWRDGFEPVAELDHPYLSSDEIRYGPPDPRPLWRAQCAALEVESHKRHGQPFVELERRQQERILRRHLSPDRGDSLPPAARASHIAIALMAWYFATPEANDLCYGVSIGRYGCRGLPTAVDQPAALSTSREE